MLNARQQKFVVEYLVDLNATQAAIRAGYSAKTAQEQASRLLSKVMIAEAIRSARKQTERKLEISRERVVERLYLITQASIADMMEHDANGAHPKDFSDFSREAKAAISEQTFSFDKDGNATSRIRMHSPIEAAKALANMMGWHEHENKPPAVSRTINILNANVDLSKLPLAKLEQLKQLVESCDQGY